MFVTACYDFEQGKAKEGIVEQLNVVTLITRPRHFPTGASTDAIALFSAKDCVDPTSYLVALSCAQATELQSTMEHQYTTHMDNGTWELVDLPADRVVVNNMWIFKIKSDT
jgi:hypothetical protein